MYGHQTIRARDQRRMIGVAGVASVILAALMLLASLPVAASVPTHGAQPGPTPAPRPVLESSIALR
jgi:hypothetical protein